MTSNQKTQAIQRLLQYISSILSAIPDEAPFNRLAIRYEISPDEAFAVPQEALQWQEWEEVKAILRRRGRALRMVGAAEGVEVDFDIPSCCEGEKGLVDTMRVQLVSAASGEIESDERDPGI